MTIRYLVDTNILSEPIKPNPNPKVMQYLEQERYQIATASVVWHELLFGCQRLPLSRRRSQIEAYFQDLQLSGLLILPYTQPAAEWHAKERVRLAALGQTPAFADGMIAAIAYQHELVLVTRNVNDFIGFSGLQMENWFE
ncbi:type II toxin-antitoxin system VapC family toxin [Thiofilum flexile]|uniref:type II toxin-antitoxin system VapC family toxin n=1 Tax=Thiofilum flexile TaxID=125627 RepID=UPI000361C01B|nr:type II toxin-antitoxin system VapC family toxin [Thiofilum flexile]